MFNSIDTSGLMLLLRQEVVYGLVSLLPAGMFALTESIATGVGVFVVFFGVAQFILIRTYWKEIFPYGLWRRNS